MTPTFPVLELFDRLAIAEVKWDRTKANQEELAWYKTQSEKYNFETIKQVFNDLKKIHNDIWELEWQLKTGVEDQLPLEEIGRRAIAIRNLNNQRIEIKNRMATLLECPVREIKKDHLSQ
jgi:hypothetical protein